MTFGLYSGSLAGDALGADTGSLAYTGGNIVGNVAGGIASGIATGGAGAIGHVARAGQLAGRVNDLVQHGGDILAAGEKLASGDTKGALKDVARMAGEAAGGKAASKVKLGRGGDANAGKNVKPSGSKGNQTGKVYRVDGERTPSGKPYVGRTTQSSPEARGSRDGRDRTGAEVVDSYDGNDTAAGRRAEQKAMNREGGKDNLDNKRNEIREDKWKENGIDPPESSP